MFTVVIAEKEHLDGINEYSAFLKPFLDAEDVAFCEWIPEAHGLADIVPELVGKVSRHEEWRAVVIADGAGLRRKNPFDLADYVCPVRGKEESREEYLPRVRSAKFAAFDRAAKQPLTRLVSYLCESPLIAEGRNNASQDPEFAEYIAESRRKQELRREITGGEVPVISLPAELLCIARRTYDESDEEISTLWTPHIDHNYSRFYDWNLYFDKMRYLVFDILPEDHKNYSFDYIRFLYVTMLLASCKTPAGSISPNRVYNIGCENEEAALVRLFTGYNAKLIVTEELLETKLRALQAKQKEHLSDRECEAIFCGSVSIPVVVMDGVNKNGLYAAQGDVGLSTDCPVFNESTVWQATYAKSRKTLGRMEKQSRRALKRAASDMRSMKNADLDRALLLNELQLEDVEEHLHEEELSMVDTETFGLYNTEKYEKLMESQDGPVKRTIGTRMTRARTIALGSVALILFLMSFLPLLIDNIDDGGALEYAFWIAFGAVLALAIAAFICLVFLRGELTARLRAFNTVMHSIDKEIEDGMASYSKYLGHVCNVMRGFSVVNFCNSRKDPDTLLASVYKKHILDLRQARANTMEVFGQFVSDKELSDQLPEAYDYNFDRAVDYDFPIHFDEGKRRQIEFIQAGNYVYVPVDFIKRVTLRREELYE